jgi:hypothetical protein
MPDMNGVLSSIFDASNNAIRISAANDTYFLGAAALQTAGTIVVTNDVPRIQFPDAATTTAYATFTLPNTWTQANFGVVYSGSTAGTANVRWQGSIKKLDVFSDVITEAFFSDVLSTVATPTTANQVTATNTNASVDVTPFPLGDVYSYRIQRLGADGADAYTGIVEIIGISIARV